MIGPLISAGSSIVGGLINRDASRRATNMTRDNLNAQMQMQKDFAKSGIRWRVEDARKAGIHPLYALGANTPQYTPTSATFAADTSLGNSFAAAGQDIGRAINSTRTASERETSFTRSMQNLQLENAGLDLEIKKTQLASAIARNRDNATPPGPAGSDNILEWDKQGKATPLTAMGKQLGTDRGWSDGQNFEDRWGEWGGSIGGLGTMAADLMATYRHKMTPLEISRSIADALLWVDKNIKPFHR